MFSATTSFANLPESASSSQQLKAGEVPDGLSSQDWGSIQTQIKAGKYKAYPDNNGNYTSSNPAHGWQIRYEADGTTTLSPRDQDTSTYHLGLKLNAIGYQTLTPLERPKQISSHDNTLEYHWNDNLTERWVNSETDLEQWFFLKQRPNGQTSEQPLTLQLSLNTNLGATQEGNNLRFITPSGKTITYNKLKVWDATGRQLPARMHLDAQQLSLVVDDSTAHYPLTIDPSFQQQAYLKASNTDSSDRFGSSVAIAGDTVVVGASGEDSSATGVDGDQSNNSGFDSGAAYVFTRNAGSWTQQAYLKASNTGWSDGFGSSVAIAGDTVVVGASGEGSNELDIGNGSGAAYVFTRSGGIWSQQAYLKASNTEWGDQFGWSVAIAGDTVVVGQSSDPLFSWAAYVFIRSGVSWTQKAYLKASNTHELDLFGTSVAISGNTVVVGAHGEASNATGVNGDQSNGLASGSGAAYVFSLPIFSPALPGSFTISNDPPYWDESPPPAGPAVQLRWGNSANANSYEVYRNGVKIHPTSGTYSGTTFRNEIGLTSGQTYTYYILARNAAGTKQSNSIAIGPMPYAPTAPVANLVSPNPITQGNSYQDVTITGSNLSAANWHQFSTDGGTTWVPAQSAPTVNSSTSITVGVNNTIVRTVFIRVCASYGSSACSSSVSVTIQAASGEIAPMVSNVLPVPDTITQGSGSQDVMLTGTAFNSENRYQQSTNGGSSWAWAPTAPTLNNVNLLTVAVDNTVVRTMNIRVCASQDSSVCSGSVAIDVQPAPSSTPSITSIVRDTNNVGTGYENLIIIGDSFTESSWHQFSIDNGASWNWAQSAPVIKPTTLMTVAISNTVARTVLLRVCDSYGGSSCSGTKELEILEPDNTYILTSTCLPTGCTTETNSTQATVITHGWFADANVWAVDMAKSICREADAFVDNPNFPSSNQAPANDITLVCAASFGGVTWDVWVVDWRTASGKSDLVPTPTKIPYFAWKAAKSKGSEVVEFFKDKGYKHYHLIGHSAGANLIDTATVGLNHLASIHETFLDAYDPSVRHVVEINAFDVTRHISLYGSKADWVDSYVDTRPLLWNIEGDGEFNWDPTDLHLTNGYNIDVTPDIDGCDNLSIEDFIGKNVCRHGRPYRFYQQSVVGTDSNYPQLTKDPILGTGSRGFPISKEGGSNMGFLENSKNSECRMQDENEGSCTFVPWTPYLVTYIPGAVKEVLVKGVIGTGNFVIGVGEVSAEIAGEVYKYLKLTTKKLLPGLVSRQFQQSRVAGTSDEPAYITAGVTTTETTNVLRFHWAFQSDGEGVLKVFVNGDLVRKIDQRHVSQASTEMEEIYIGGAEGSLPPGTHDISFRLDGFGENVSDIDITNVQLGYKGISGNGTAPDTDGDGITDDIDLDDDNDGMPDAWELQYGLDPFLASDAVLDNDGDNISNLDEYNQGINPLVANVLDANNTVVTRAEITKPILLSIYGLEYLPPEATGLVFPDDVQKGDFNADWIEKLAADEITEG